MLYTNLVYMSIYHFGLSYNILCKKREGSFVYSRIRGLREDRDLRQKDIADYLHCSQVAYSRYELGTRDVPSEVLIALAEFHETSVDYLLGVTDVKTPYPPAKHRQK